MTWHSLHVLWFNYAWPSDEGNGPEGIQQTIVYGAIAILLIPRVRKWLKRETEHLHQKLDQVIGHHETHAKSLAALHAKLDALTPKAEQKVSEDTAALDAKPKPPQRKRPAPK